MVRDEVCGTWWYCVNENGSRWLVDGDKPRRSGGGYMAVHSKYSWLPLDTTDRSIHKDGVKISGEDFANVKFPDRTYEDGPLEIEIVKSGNVYWYDN